MVHLATLHTLLIGAGAGIVHAFPHPQWRGESNNFPKFSFGSFGYPTETRSNSLPAQPSSSIVAPASFSASGGRGPTGTGYSRPSGTGTPLSFSSVPVGTGLSIVLSYHASSASVTVAPSGSVGVLYSGVASSIASYSGASSESAVASGSGAPSGSIAASASVAPSVSVGAISSGVGSSVVSYSIGPGSSAAADSSAPSSVAAPSSNPSASASSGTVTASSGCTFTDADTAAASKGSCSAIVLSGITVPAGETLDMTDLNDGTTVSFEGTTTFDYEEWEGPLISFSGKSITITGASGHVIDGNGAKWWDGEGSNGGKTKPKFFYAHDLTDSTIQGLNVKNTPVQGFSVDGAQNLKIEDVTIDDSDGDSQGGHNTDCFDIGDSTGVYLSGVNCMNQDDCIAINSGTDIQFTGGKCSGGHGLSIGSVGGRDDNTVENIYIASSSVSDSENGVRIKCNSGDTGTVKNVTYDSITLSGITDYGIVIEQDYENGDPTGIPTDGIPITDITLSDITGSVTDDAQAYYILCASCDDWTVSGVDVTGGSQSDDCEGVPSGASSLC